MESLSIVIPAFNEEDTIHLTLSEIIGVCKELGLDFEIVVVDDGSRDNTSSVLEEFKDVMLVRHSQNMGFGRAIWSGISKASKENILLVPADGQFDPCEIPLFLDGLKNSPLVIGCRVKREGQSFIRKIQSIIYIWCIKILFFQNIPDVNWVQAWRRSLFENFTPKSSGVFILQEIIAKSRMARVSINCVPSCQRARRGGVAHGGKVTTILKTIGEMLKFWAFEFVPWFFNLKKIS